MTVTLRRDPGHLSRGSLEGRRPGCGRASGPPSTDPGFTRDRIIESQVGQSRLAVARAQASAYATRTKDDGCWSVPLSLRLDVRGLDHLGPFCEFEPAVLREFLRRAGDRLEAEHRQTLQDVGQLHDRDRLT